MPTYIEVHARHQPLDIGLDSLNRVMWSANYDLWAPAAAESTLEDDIAAYLATQLSLTIATDIFIGTKARIPDGNGPFTTILRTSGASTFIDHGNRRYPRLSVQIVTRGDSYATSRARAVAIQQALDGQYGLVMAA